MVGICFSFSRNNDCRSFTDKYLLAKLYAISTILLISTGEDSGRSESSRTLTFAVAVAVDVLADWNKTYDEVLLFYSA